MNRINYFFLTFTNKILAGLLSLIGFSLASCDIEEEYGCPYANYEIKGKVVDEGGNAIPGIQVSISQSPMENEYLRADTVISTPSGTFTSQPPTYSFGGNVTFKITAKDIDGEANGGLFKDEETEVAFKKEDLKGASGDWFYGSAQKNVTVTMRKEGTGDK